MLLVYQIDVEIPLSSPETLFIVIVLASTAFTYLTIVDLAFYICLSLLNFYWQSFTSMPLVISEKNIYGQSKKIFKKTFKHHVPLTPPHV